MQDSHIAFIVELVSLEKETNGKFDDLEVLRAEVQKLLMALESVMTGEFKESNILENTRKQVVSAIEKIKLNSI